MEDCRSIGPLISRVVEGEATPIDSLRVARHGADCTHCKIVLSRERRLAQLLEQGLPELSIGEDLVAVVMEKLPEGPPPSRRGRHEGLRLASLFGGLVGGIWLLSTTALPGSFGHILPSLPTHRYETSLPLLEQLVSVAGMAWMALRGASSTLLPVVTPAEWPTLLIAISIGLAAGMALLSTSLFGFVAYGLGGLLRQSQNN